MISTRQWQEKSSGRRECFIIAGCLSSLSETPRTGRSQHYQWRGGNFQLRVGEKMVCAAKAGPDANVRGWISKSQSPSFNMRSTRLIAACSLLPKKGIINYFRCQKTLIHLSYLKCVRNRKREGGGKGRGKKKKKPCDSWWKSRSFPDSHVDATAGAHAKRSVLIKSDNAALAVYITNIGHGAGRRVCRIKW